MTKREAKRLIKLCKKQMQRTRRFNAQTSKIVGSASVNTTQNAVYIRTEDDFRELCKVLGLNYGLHYVRGEEGLSVWLTAHTDINIKCYKGAIDYDSSTEND